MKLEFGSIATCCCLVNSCCLAFRRECELLFIPTDKRLAVKSGSSEARCVFGELRSRSDLLHIFVVAKSSL